MHILVISQYFYPEQFRINDICKEWIKRGYKVTVVTGIPNYPEGRFYEGYGLFKKRREKYNGIDIIRLPLVPRGKNPIMLILNYLSFVVSGGIWCAISKIQPDNIFIFEVSPMTQALPAVWYGRKRKIPCFLYMQDLWPDNVEIVTGLKNRRVLSGLNRMVNYIYHRCAHIFTTSQSFEKELVKRGVNKKCVSYWPQYAEDFYKPLPRKKKEDLYTVIFTGNIGYAQGLDILPKVADYLRGKNIKFILVGDGRYQESLRVETEKLQVGEMFEFVGKRRPEEIPEYLSSADAAFLSFMNSPLFEKTIPAKLQSYMACAMPIIASANGETKRIIEESGCGMCAALGDAKGLADIIEKMQKQDAEAMGMKALDYYKKNFDKEKLLYEMDLYLGRTYV